MNTPTSISKVYWIAIIAIIVISTIITIAVGHFKMKHGEHSWLYPRHSPVETLIITDNGTIYPCNKCAICKYSETK